MLATATREVCLDDPYRARRIVTSPFPELVNLSDMISNFALLLGGLTNLDQVREWCTANPHHGVIDTEVDVQRRFIDGVKKGLQIVRSQCEQYELDAALKRVARIELRLSRITAAELEGELRTLAETISDQLEGRWFIYIPIDRTRHFTEPDKYFGAGYEAFPSAREDMFWACRCFATGNPAATVYHSMGVVQRGMFALARELSVSFPFGLELAEWQNVIEQSEAKIRGLRLSLPKGQEKDEQVSFYSNVATQLHYVKDAWRNHVMHVRESYDLDQASSILTHTRDFMSSLARRIREEDAPC